MANESRNFLCEIHTSFFLQCITSTPKAKNLLVPLLVATLDTIKVTKPLIIGMNN